MKFKVGDWVVVSSKKIDIYDQVCEIIELSGYETYPYRVRFNTRLPLVSESEIGPSKSRIIHQILSEI